MRTIFEAAEDIKSILNNIERTENCDGEILVDINALIDEIIMLQAKSGWIPCGEHMPEEHESVFARFKGTEKWNKSMFEKISDRVNVTVDNNKGKVTVTHAHTIDGKWSCDLLRCNKDYRIIAWMPLPEPYKG